ncbi:hypothetical protein PISS_a2687 [Pseudoalteromonas issachenkonii]|uniref:Uncharacterized protein n=1 Tax=Pseudoalteromonas issachenkonii TaxID=152297 RepID=A0ABM6N5K1_9GAMM|nr:hypothetical protein PISS_a2687 [Pseudoalteromonas issachenkonii]
MVNIPNSVNINLTPKPKIICKSRSASKAVKLFMHRSIRFVCDLG